MDPSPQCEGIFQLFDADRSGQIDVREFMISLTNFAGASKDDKLKFAFMIFDEDGNGVITKQEVRCTVQWIGSLKKTTRSTVNMTSSNDGTVCVWAQKVCKTTHCCLKTRHGLTRNRNQSPPYRHVCIIFV